MDQDITRLKIISSVNGNCNVCNVYTLSCLNSCVMLEFCWDSTAYVYRF